jgi:multicomponent Na+:H+ antiporter subunit E
VRRLTSHLGLLLWLTLVWMALWGSATVANLLGGLLVAAVLLVLLPLPTVPRESDIRPVALLRLAVVFFWELIKASFIVVVQVLRPASELRQAVVAVPVIGVSDRLLTLLANAVSLTPGTLALEVDRPRATLYVHVLNVGGDVDAVEEIRASIVRLERLAILAMGSPDCLRALDEATGPGGKEVRR